ncbi:MAG: hypothetical protein QN141_13510 [Armatimonadota bacterium]|nr:hypothetical protein [Armatimonadota bacterium]MDR7559494.1 hypothetical protein [Armatimonadota bacterium]
MVTLEEALRAHTFHYGRCRVDVGPRGGAQHQIEAWRRAGATKTWKTRPGEFRVPLRHGLWASAELNHANAHLFHAAENCPLFVSGLQVHGAVEGWLGRTDQGRFLAGGWERGGQVVAVELTLA